MSERTFRCANCSHAWSVPFGSGRPETCPECGSEAVHRKHSEGEGECFGPGLGRSAGYGSGGRGSCGGGQPGRNRCKVRGEGDR